MDHVSTVNLGILRRQLREHELEVRRLEAQVAHLEKQLEAREDDAVGKRLGEVQAKLDLALGERQRLTDAVEGAEAELAQHAESTEELEQLVDSFAAVLADAAELAPVLTAMKLCVGALATSRRLERSHEALSEPKDISRALAQALTLLATTLSSASGLERLKTSA
jgi:chromosome segregation ATPase